MPKYYIENGKFFCQDRYKRIELHPTALANLAGVDRKTAVRWCSGRQDPHPDRAALIALRALGKILPTSGPWADIWVENDALRLADGGTVPATALPARSFELQMLELLKVEIRQAREYIRYLESMLPRAPVVRLDTAKTRPPAVSKMDRKLNRYFEGSG